MNFKKIIDYSWLLVLVASLVFLGGMPKKLNAQPVEELPQKYQKSVEKRQKHREALEKERADSLEKLRKEFVDLRVLLRDDVEAQWIVDETQKIREAIENLYYDMNYVAQWDIDRRTEQIKEAEERMAKELVGLYRTRMEDIQQRSAGMKKVAEELFKSKGEKEWPPLVTNLLEYLDREHGYVSILGKWQDQEGLIWTIGKEEGKGWGAYDLPSPYDGIKKKQAQIDHIKSFIIYVWQNQETGQVVVQKRWQQLDYPFGYLYQTYSISHAPAELALLEQEMAEIKKADENQSELIRNRDNPFHLPRPTTDGKIRLIKLTKTRKDGSIQNWPLARYYSQGSLEAQGVFDNIQDMKPELPLPVKLELARSWYAPRWIELSLKLDPATGQARLEGKSWAHHVTYSGEDYKVKRIHDPYAKPLILTKIIEAPAKAAKPETPQPETPQPQPAPETQVKPDTPATKPPKDDKEIQEIKKRYEKLHQKVNADFDQQVSDWRRYGPSNEKLRQEGAKDIERERERSLRNLDREMNQELEKLPAAKGEANKP